MSIAFQYQPRQQQQRLPRLPFVSLDVAVVGVAADVVVAVAAVGAEHGPALGLVPVARVHENLDIQGEPALWYLATGYRGGLVSLDLPPDSRGRFGETVAPPSILALKMVATHFAELHCTSAAVWDAAGQTRQLTYRPCWALATVGQPPTVEAGPATRGPPYLETDGRKPGRILGSPRPKALAVFCQLVGDTAPRLPTDGRCCLRW